MNSIDSLCGFRLILVDTRLFHRVVLKRVLRHHPDLREVHAVPNVDAALKLVFSKRFASDTPKKTLFLFGMDSYLKVLPKIKRVVTCCPASKRILVDEMPKPGCAVLAERFSIHGFTTLFDSPEAFRCCVDQVLQGETFVSNKVAAWLQPDPHRQCLAVRDELKTHAPHTFSSKEWFCFKYLIQNKDLSALAEHLQLTPRTIRNIQYKVMEKSGVQKLVDLIRLAHHWGFLD